MTKVIPLSIDKKPTNGLSGSKYSGDQTPTDPFVGVWEPADLYSDIVISVSKEDGEYAVNVIDTDDEEQAEVYELKYENSELSFNVHWVSNGRFVKYGLLLLSNNIVRLVYTYSGQETWVKRES